MRQNDMTIYVGIYSWIEYSMKQNNYCTEGYTKDGEEGVKGIWKVQREWTPVAFESFSHIFFIQFLPFPSHICEAKYTFLISCLTSDM